MATTIELKDLKRIRVELTACIAIIRSEAFRSQLNKEISDSEFLKIKNKWAELEVIELELQGEIMNRELDFILNTSVDSPRSRIIQATDKLTSAARNIDNVTSFLTEVANVVGIFTNLITAIQTGGILNIP